MGIIALSQNFLLESLKIKRYIAAAGLGFIAWTLGIFSALSFDLLAGFTPIGDKNFFDSLDFLSNQVLLPLGGIFIAIFVGWVMKRSDVFEELNLKEGLVLKAWFFLLKFVSPLVVGLIFVLAVFFGVVT